MKLVGAFLLSLACALAAGLDVEVTSQAPSTEAQILNATTQASNDDDDDDGDTLSYFNFNTETSNQSYVRAGEELTLSCYIEDTRNETDPNEDLSEQFKLTWVIPLDLMMGYAFGIEPRRWDIQVDERENGRIYESRLRLFDIGKSHEGLYSCYLRTWDKLGVFQKAYTYQFMVNVTQLGSHGDACSLDDQCATEHCEGGQCICGRDMAVVNGNCFPGK